MKLRNYTFLLFLTIGVLFTSCKDTLDLDDETILKIEKQEKLKQLDALYDMAFEDPIKAEADFEQYVRNELITERQNFLIDDEVNNFYTLSSLAIQMGVSHEQGKNTLDKQSLFELYASLYKTDLYNRTLLGSIPEQLKQGVRLKKFQDKIDEINEFHKDQIVAFENNTNTENSLVDKNWFGGGLAYKSDFSAMYPIQFDFTLHADKSWTYENFFFIPSIPQVGALAGIQDEKDLDKEDIISPMKYYVYGDRIFFRFQIRNTYDYETEKGKLERIWCYEFKYEINAGQLKLTEPRIVHYMYPVLTTISFDEPLYKTNYLEGFNGFENGFTLHVMP